MNPKTQRPAYRQFEAATQAVLRHPLFEAMLYGRSAGWTSLGRATWSTVDRAGHVVCDQRLAATEEWMWVIAHQLCHLGMGHLADGRRVERDGRIDPRWNAACCVEVDRFLAHLKIGRCPFALPALPEGDAESLWRRWRDSSPPEADPGLYGVADHGDLRAGGGRSEIDWEERFAHGLRGAVTAAIEVAGGERDSLSSRDRGFKTDWRRALDWFIASYPLLGGIAAGLRLIEDLEVCRTSGIRLAAVNAGAGEIFLNPQVVMAPEERRFVVAHEILHAALRHDERTGDRDPWLWNVATDFTINGWLVEMDVGEIPDGSLYDPELKGWSAEEVYERIARDLRRFRKASTFAGSGVCDVLARGEGRGATNLDDFYRRALAHGLEHHTTSGRGLLPAGLVEEIRARTHPPIGWQVELAQWFDDWLPVAERRRTYARLSRRQAATPDIPRPALVAPEEWERTRTFGVLIDSSGSMGAELLGKALGAVASYCAARDVARARVVFCDAAAYDAGWLSPDDIAGRVKVRGRGGTILQPGIDLLERSADFPTTGPILVITDAGCDRLRIRREHAFLIPHGRRLPFRPKGPVFRMH